MNMRHGSTMHLSPVVIIALVIIAVVVQPTHGNCIPRGGCSTALASYQVVDADTLFALAARFMTTSDEVLKYNSIPDINSIEVGQDVLFPFPCECIRNSLGYDFSYKVALDETVVEIADVRFNRLTKEEWILNASNLKNASTIFADMMINVPVNCSCGNPGVSLDYGLFITYPPLGNDTAPYLAEKFGANETLLRQYNPSINWSNLSASADVIFIPTKEVSTGIYPLFNNSGDGGSSGSSNTGLIVGVSVGGSLALILIVLLLLCIFCIYRPRKQASSKEDTILDRAHADGGHGSGMLKFSQEGAGHSGSSTGAGPSVLSEFSVDKSVEFSFEELEAATNKFSAANKIGEGGYGSVYLANLRGQKLAVKRMNLQATREFLAELQVLTHVHHTNLVQLIGYCTVESLFLIYEYVENGTLDRHLDPKHGLPMLSWAARVQIALDTARGLEYIHEHTKPTYVHRDVKSSNILIDLQLHAKVADFGLTKLTESGAGSFSTRAVGTYGYMSPEYAQFGDVSPKLDVYAFGVVLFEVISAKTAIVRITDNQEGTNQEGHYEKEQRHLVTLFEGVLQDPSDREKLKALVDPALGNNYPLDSVWKMAQLARACTQETPELRPTMRTAVVALMTLSSSTQDWNMHAYGSDRVIAGIISGR